MRTARNRLSHECVLSATQRPGPLSECLSNCRSSSLHARRVGKKLHELQHVVRIAAFVQTEMLFKLWIRGRGRLKTVFNGLLQQRMSWTLAPANARPVGLTAASVIIDHFVSGLPRSLVFTPAVHPRAEPSSLIHQHFAPPSPDQSARRIIPMTLTIPFQECQLPPTPESSPEPVPELLQDSILIEAQSTIHGEPSPRIEFVIVLFYSRNRSLFYVTDWVLGWALRLQSNKGSERDSR